MELNYCEDCNVYVDACLKKCPLCKKVLTENPSDDTMYPEVTKVKYIDKRDLNTDMLMFLTFVVIGICALVNVLTWHGVLWIVTVAAGLFFVWVLVKIVVMSDMFAGTKAFVQVLALFALAISIDYTAGFRGWSYEYVLPFILIASIVYIDLYSFFHKSYWRDNLLYAILFVALGFIPLVLYLTGLTHAFVPAVLSAVASVVTILGMLRFMVRQIRNEMRKRLHM